MQSNRGNTRHHWKPRSESLPCSANHSKPYSIILRTNEVVEELREGDFVSKGVGSQILSTSSRSRPTSHLLADSSSAETSLPSRRAVVRAGRAHQLPDIHPPPATCRQK